MGRLAETAHNRLSTTHGIDRVRADRRSTHHQDCFATVRVRGEESLKVVEEGAQLSTDMRAILQRPEVLPYQVYFATDKQ
ncbi:unnamed protein product [Zymoseptoria tritici ST99CH_3D7]|uniref:Uncharacterized protein n=1 Tax=Zymoseptoria tritici (strain ST99CH_3D7) TaxID=1276538 RepID=A0A1X7REX4_ZYMT9|nr:unnamed protein product [Zymoseptoria tritici ST99CH_3D7]